MEIKVSEEIKKACPQFAGIAIRATVENTAYSESLWKKIDEFTICYREMYTTDSIKDMVTIHATREAYKKCGKDPSRYRPSGEALCRRILRGISLYQIDTLVDLINLVSIRYGYSIGGFDADKIQGDTLVLGIGKSGFYQIPGIMTINTFQSIIMTHNNYISISSVCFCHTYYSIKRTTDSIIGLSLYIRSTVPPAGSVCRNHFTTGKRKTIFILFYTIQMNGETFAPVKEPGSLDSDMVYFHCGKITLGRPPSPCRHTYEQ